MAAFTLYHSTHHLSQKIKQKKKRVNISLEKNLTLK